MCFALFVEACRLWWKYFRTSYVAYRCVDTSPGCRSPCWTCILYYFVKIIIFTSKIPSMFLQVYVHVTFVDNSEIWHSFSKRRNNRDSATYGSIDTLINLTGIKSKPFYLILIVNSFVDSFKFHIHCGPKIRFSPRFSPLTLRGVYSKSVVNVACAGKKVRFDEEKR